MINSSNYFSASAFARSVGFVWPRLLAWPFGLLGYYAALALWSLIGLAVLHGVGFSGIRGAARAMPSRPQFSSAPSLPCSFIFEPM
jgi:hypothetical protein